MKTTMLRLFGFVIMFSLALAVPAFAADTMKHGHGGHDMAMHHQHIMLNHALGMALDGSNMVMLGEMGMAKGVDKLSLDHGKMMLKHGRDLLNDLMSGDVMMKMHGAGTSPSNDPLMKYTHELAEAQLKVIDLLSNMPSAAGMGHGMTMHHHHEMLNHALGMALEGSNMVMLGQMGMARGVDDISLEHGKTMIKHAHDLFNEIMSGETMTDMHKGGVTPEKDAAMGYTHKLAEAQMKVMKLLRMMPSVM